jgi:hypothetical protein
LDATDVASNADSFDSRSVASKRGGNADDDMSDFIVNDDEVYDDIGYSYGDPGLTVSGVDDDARDGKLEDTDKDRETVDTITVARITDYLYRNEQVAQLKTSISTKIQLAL